GLHLGRRFLLQWSAGRCRGVPPPPYHRSWPPRERSVGRTPGFPYGEPPLVSIQRDAAALSPVRVQTEQAEQLQRPDAAQEQRVALLQGPFFHQGFDQTMPLKLNPPIWADFAIASRNLIVKRQKPTGRLDLISS